ncbi:MAG: hypothetical protein GEU97_21865 [Actinophytocola sp.]|nr:hypothetical protein [Actinophytocola sp.]
MVRIDSYLANKSAAVGDVEDIAFDADGMQRIIDDTNDLIQRKLFKAKQEATDVTEWILTQPNHPAGDDFVLFAREHAQRYSQFNDEYVDSLRNFVKKLEKLRADVTNREDDLSWGFDKGMQA